MKYLLTCITLAITLQVCAQTEQTHYCYFESGSSQLEAAAKENLASWLDELPAETEFQIQGFTDSIGSTAYNIDLSKARVETVKQALLKRGIMENRLEPEYLGENLPIAPNDTENGRQLNRRVKITAILPPADTSNIHQLFALLDEGYQVYTIDPSQDTLLQTESGGFIKIPAKVFAVPAPCRNGGLTIRVKEVFDASHAIIENLTTTSNGEILSSRGMIYVDALCSNKPLKLRKGKSLSHVMPVKDDGNDLIAFKGLRNPTDSSINWVAFQNAGFTLNDFTIGVCCGKMDAVYYCPLFFCRIRRWFNKDMPSNPNSTRLGSAEDCNALYLFTEYGLENKDAVHIAMAKYKVETYEALYDTLQRIKMQQFENSVREGTASTDEISNFIFKQSRLGWANCDFFSRFPDSKLITIRTGIQRNPQTRSFLVFRDQNIILPASFNNRQSSDQVFSMIPAKESVTLVSLRYTNGRAMISTHNFTTGQKLPDLKFKEVTIPQLKRELAMLNGEPTVAFLERTSR